jgi:hypothetical protein
MRRNLTSRCQLGNCKAIEPQLYRHHRKAVSLRSLSQRQLPGSRRKSFSSRKRATAFGRKRDPQYNASLPFDVSEPRMLTIFWADHWWSSGNTNTPCIILHSLEELVHCEPPPGTPERPPMKAHLEAKRQLPPVGEIWNVLHTCFGELPTEMVDALQLSLKEDDRQITKHSRIGGNPYWIQESRPRFIAQLYAHDLTGIEFGDAGCLYIVGPNAHELRGYVQCY